MELKRCSRQKQQRRKAAAVTEMAVCLPLLFTIIFGSIEACNVIYLKQVLTAAAYEGVLVAMPPHTKQSEVHDRIHDILSARKITGATITIDGPGLDFEDILHGDRFTVTVQAPTDQNVPDPRLFGVLTEITGSITAEKQ